MRATFSLASPSMSMTVPPDECTEAHVFEHIKVLEDQANEELGQGIDYGQLPAPFDLRLTDEDLYDHERDTKDQYLPVIKKALGIRHFLDEDSAEDTALRLDTLERCHVLLKWYYVAIRTEPDLFTIIKYRSPSPCPSLTLKLAGLERAYAEHRPEYAEDGAEEFVVFVPCGTVETADVEGVEPQEGKFVATRLWDVASRFGGSMVSLSPEEGGLYRFHGPDWPWLRMEKGALTLPDALSFDDLWDTINPTARVLKRFRGGDDDGNDDVDDQTHLKWLEALHHKWLEDQEDDPEVKQEVAEAEAVLQPGSKGKRPAPVDTQTPANSPAPKRPANEGKQPASKRSGK